MKAVERDINLLHFQKPSIFVEFGSGRGQLTYWLTMALAHAHVKDQDPTNSTSRPVSGNNISKHSEFVLVDRGSQRHKMDNKLKNEESCYN